MCLKQNMKIVREVAKRSLHQTFQKIKIEENTLNYNELREWEETSSFNRFPYKCYY